MCNILRKYKISLLTDVGFTSDEKYFISILKNEISDIKEFKHIKYPHSIFYFNGTKLVLEQDNSRNSIYYRQDLFEHEINNKINLFKFHCLFTYFIKLKLPNISNNFGTLNTVYYTSKIEKLFF
jgi:hypothetical protein